MQEARDNEYTEGVTVIEDRAFKNCELLTTITLPANISKIGKDVFEGCNSLREIKAPREIAGQLVMYYRILVLY